MSLNDPLYSHIAVRTPTNWFKWLLLKIHHPEWRWVICPGCQERNAVLRSTRSGRYRGSCVYCGRFIRVHIYWDVDWDGITRVELVRAAYKFDFDEIL